MGVRPSDAEIYDKYADALVRFAAGLVGPTDAPDVVSATMLRVLWSSAWEQVRNPQAFLYQAVLNEAKMHHRSTMRRRAREQRAAGPGSVLQPEVRPEVLAAVGRLSPRQRAVTFLAYWEGLTPADIADRLGIGEGSVRRHLARARKHLRRMLHE
jgi:RNA polymerase sigma factor (sigma-70 family)